ncbi:hypothetical protein [Tropicimonas sp. S265A]|uniref:hypothetical protein n=1 Tax=Tropicimonas sp. S265A TaxID=3415134 RepID=UPI003C7E44D0
MLLSAPQTMAQEAANDRTAAIELVERAQNTLDILRPLVELETDLKTRIAELAGDGSREQSEDTAEELEDLNRELSDVQEQISVLVTGVSEEGYRALDEAEFDLNAELQQLVEPFVLLLNQATNEARAQERTRRDLDIANQRLASANLALTNIEAALDRAGDPSVLERLNANAELWQDRQASHQTQVDALTQRLTDLQTENGPVGQNVNSAFQGFFQERGTSLIMGFGAFVGVLIATRLLAYAGRSVAARRIEKRTFAMRLGGVLFAVFSLIAAFGAMIWVFNMRNDWLLLGLALLLLIAAVWVVFKMLPSLLEQLSVLLNLGAVQEGERVLFNDVPYKVQRLSFFTDLVNPALDGGEFTLPVRELVGMHSRPAAEDEAWFPSEKGDWVRLADDNAGQVIAQTPEMVVVELLGGARVTYQTADYLAATPVNLSHGYRVEVEFGVAYKHQDQSTDTIITQLRDGVAAHFARLLGPDELRNVDVEFLRAGASSLDYEVEIDVAGSAAHRFEELERELARCLVRLATRHGWEIPFQQVVIHNPEPRQAHAAQ